MWYKYFLIGFLSVDPTSRQRFLDTWMMIGMSVGLVRKRLVEFIDFGKRKKNGRMWRRRNMRNELLYDDYDYGNRKSKKGNSKSKRNCTSCSFK